MNLLSLYCRENSSFQHNHFSGGLLQKSEVESVMTATTNFTLCSLINGCSMKRFKTFLKEAKRGHPLWVRTITAGLVLKIQRLETEIALTDDLVKQNRLLAQISKLLSYMSGLSIGTSSTDPRILNKIKAFSKIK